MMYITVTSRKRIVLFVFFILFVVFHQTDCPSAAGEGVNLIRISTDVSLLNKSVAAGSSDSDIKYELKGIDEKSHSLSSSDASIFTVKETGNRIEIKGIKEGVAKLTLTVKAQNGKTYTDMAYINVYSPFSEASAVTTKRTMVTRSARAGTDNKNERGYAPKGTKLKVYGQCKGYYRIKWENNTLGDDLDSDLGYISKSDIIIPIVNVKLSADNIVLEENSSRKVEAIITPTTATNKNLIWKTDKTDVADIDNNGYISSKKAGVAVMTVSSNNGITQNAIISVYKKVNPAEGNLKDDAIINEGAYEDPKGKVISAGLRLTVIGESGDYYYVSIYDKNGFIKKDQIEIPAKEITLSEYHIKIMQRECFRLTTAIKPETATNKEICWRSLDSSIADVTEGGKVVAKEEGTCIIIAENIANGIKSECKVEVKGKNENVPFAIEAETKTLEVGNEMRLIANETNIEWHSSNEKVLSVNNNGKITANSEGEAIITGIVKKEINGVQKIGKSSVKIKVLVKEIIDTVNNVKWRGGEKKYYVVKRYRKNKYKWKVSRYDKKLVVKKKQDNGRKPVTIKVPKRKTSYGKIYLCLLKIYEKSTGKHVANITLRIKQKWHPKTHYRAEVNRLVKACGSFGLKHTRELLKRAAHDKPKHYKRGINSEISRSIKKSNEFKRLIRRVKKKIVKSKKTALSGNCKDDKNREFGFNDVDLLLSIQHYDYTWKAKRKNKGWEVIFTITDQYDFDKIREKKYKKLALYKKPIYKAIIIPATNFALRATKCGAIKEYGITIIVKDTL